MKNGRGPYGGGRHLLGCPRGGRCRRRGGGGGQKGIETIFRFFGVGRGGHFLPDEGQGATYPFIPGTQFLGGLFHQEGFLEIAFVGQCQAQDHAGSGIGGTKGNSLFLGKSCLFPFSQGGIGPSESRPCRFPLRVVMNDRIFIQDLLAKMTGISFCDAEADSGGHIPGVEDQRPPLHLDGLPVEPAFAVGHSGQGKNNSIIRISLGQGSQDREGFLRMVGQDLLCGLLDSLPKRSRVGRVVKRKSVNGPWNSVQESNDPTHQEDPEKRVSPAVFFRDNGKIRTYHSSIMGIAEKNGKSDPCQSSRETGSEMKNNEPKIAVVTGASSGIGAETVRALVKAGFQVYGGARRFDRLERLSRETGMTPLELDVRSTESVSVFVSRLPEAVHVLVNNAGGALGLDPVLEMDEMGWLDMYQSNVLGTARMARALFPKLCRSGLGHLVNIGSVAALETYTGGAGYTAAKHAVRAITETLRLEWLGKPVRITEIDPGLVNTEFSLVRFNGDAEKAKRVYEGMTPLSAEDVAEAVSWVVTRPAHVNVDSLLLRPLDQARVDRIFRRPSVP